MDAVRDPDRIAVVRETGLHDLETPDSLGYLSTLALRTLDVSTAFVSFVDEEVVVVRASRGSPTPLVDEGAFPAEDSFCQQVVATGEPVAISDARRHEGLPGTDFAAEHGLVSYLEVPVAPEEGCVIGGFCVADPAPRSWTDDEIEILRNFAAGVCSEVQLRRKIGSLRERESELERRPLHDPLTGLPNRQLFWNRVSHAVARRERTGRVTGVLFLDLDGFRAINDQHGQEVGDEALKEIARRLGANIREPDTLARFGGDEFAALLEDLDEPEEAARVAARLADCFREPLRVSGRELEQSVSIGVATQTGDQAGGADDGDGAFPPTTASPGRRLVQEADWAMYRAKQEDGTRWVTY